MVSSVGKGGGARPPLWFELLNDRSRKKSLKKYREQDHGKMGKRLIG